MSLRWRVALALASLAALGAAAAASGAYATTARQLRLSLDNSLSTRAQEVGLGPTETSGGGGRRGGGAFDNIGCPPEALLRPAAAAQIVRIDGTVTPCLAGGPVLPPPSSTPESGRADLTTVDLPDGRYRVAAAQFHAGGVLQVARSESEIEGVLRALRIRLVVLAVSVALLSGVVGWFVARRLVRPVLSLRAAVRRITESNDLSTSIDTRGTGEIRDLAQNFSAMVEALATSRAQQRRLVEDASHEMRTPLTSLTTNLELIDRYDELAPEERPDVVAAIRADVDELTHLMTELVELATDRSSDEPIVSVDLADLAEAVAARARRRSGRTIALRLLGNGTVSGRPQMLERAIANLVDNAIKYSPDGTDVEIYAAPTSIEVCDRGPGFAPGDYDRIFERFWRADSARTRPGSGLGLAIVQQIVDRHEGRVFVRENTGGGARVGFTIGCS